MAVAPNRTTTTRDEHARHERANSAPIVGVVQALASEVVLEIPATVALMVWQLRSDSNDDMRCVYTSDSDDILDDWRLLTHADSPAQTGLTIISRRPAITRPLLPSFSINAGKRLTLPQSPAARRIHDLWHCHLNIDWKSNGYLITVFAQPQSNATQIPDDDALNQLSDSLVQFLRVAREAETQIRAEGINTDPPVAHESEGPIASFRRLTESPIWSLPQIEETVLRRIRATVPDLSELHLFLTNPHDSHLYYAATDQLNILPANAPPTMWKLPSLDSVYTRHIEDRLSELEQQTDRPVGSLVAFYRRIQDEGLPTSEFPKHAGLLRLVLRCLPQELACGVVGAAVREGILKVGGHNYWDLSQWKHQKKRPFFYQKLEVEKLFGVAKDGYLTAAPVYDAGQVIGGLFFVTPVRPNQEQMSVLLDGRLHASQLLAQYRTTQFTRLVIDTLEREPQARFQDVVECHLGQLLLYGLLAVADTSQGTMQITHAWYRAQGSVHFEAHGSQEIRQSRLLKTLFARIKQRNEWLMHIDRDEWMKSNLRNIFRDARACVLFPFDKDTSFLFILPEPCERLLNSLSSLQQKSAALQTVVRLRDTYARRHEVLRFHSNATFSWHNLKRRFSHPLLDVYNRMLGPLEEMKEKGLPVDHLTACVEELGVIQAIMESQFLALKDVLDVQESHKRTSINIQYILESELHKYFDILLRARDREVEDKYTGKVSLSITCPRGVRVRGHPHAFKMALLSLLENTIKDYAISKDLVAKGDPKRLAVVVLVKQHHSSVEIRVIDTGEGMSPELRRAHNERFDAIACGRLFGYQGFDKKLASSKDSGSQIGLLHAATVFAAITSSDGKMHGRIRVEPHSPFGTCFVITLPFK